MSLLLLFERVLSNICSVYSKAVFRRKIHCKHSNFKMLGNVIVNNTNVHIGKNVILYPNIMFMGRGNIFIGDNTKIGNNTIICADKAGGVHIGSNCAIAANCYIIDADHGTKKGIKVSEQEMVVGKVVIGDNVWIGTHVTVLKGSKINDGAVIGAMSLVNSEISADTINLGIPAKFVKNKL